MDILWSDFRRGTMGSGVAKAGARVGAPPFPSCTVMAKPWDLSKPPCFQRYGVRWRVESLRDVVSVQ